jgi:organic hydroperoxide reductase OsmC/OhrA
MSHTHTYRTSLVWEGSTGVGYDAYGRAHSIRADAPIAGLDLSSDPAFRGDPERLNPEQLLLAAASSCQLLSFLAVAARARLDVVSYADSAEAVMPDDHKPMRITQIVLRPVIELAAASAEVADARLDHLVEVAHRECFIANSLRSEITIQPAYVRR